MFWDVGCSPRYDSHCCKIKSHLCFKKISLGLLLRVSWRDIYPESGEFPSCKTVDLGFYSSVLFEVPKTRSGKSALEAESESLDSYTADSDSTSRWSFPVWSSVHSELSFCSLASGCTFLLPSCFLSLGCWMDLSSNLTRSLSLVPLLLGSEHCFLE